MAEVRVMVEELREGIKGERMDMSVVSDFEERIRRIDLCEVGVDNEEEELGFDLAQTISKNQEYPNSGRKHGHSALSDRTIKLNLPCAFEDEKAV